MTFKVGDRVRQVGDEYWRGMEGVYDGRRTNGDNGDDYLFDYFIPDEGSKYSDGTSASRFVGRPCGMDVGSFELIQPTQTATARLERLEAFVARVAAQKGHTSYTDEARALVAEIAPPVDADILTARKLAGDIVQIDSGCPDDWRNGKWDDSPEIIRIVEALRRARNEGEAL